MESIERICVEMEACCMVMVGVDIYIYIYIYLDDEGFDLLVPLSFKADQI